MFYQNHIVITFRNKKILEIDAQKVSIIKHPAGFSQVLFVDGEILLTFEDKGGGNVFEEGEAVHYSSFPSKKLQDYFPEDWDIEEKGFALIDKVVVDSKGRTVEGP